MPRRFWIRISCRELMRCASIRAELPLAQTIARWTSLLQWMTADLSCRSPACGASYAVPRRATVLQRSRVRTQARREFSSDRSSTRWSSASFKVGAETAAPRFGSSSSNPSDASTWKVSRSGEREIPSARTGCAPAGEPRLQTPSMISDADARVRLPAATAAESPLLRCRRHDDRRRLLH